MNFWTIFHAATAVIYVFSFFYVLSKNFYSLTNWILSFVFLCLAVWSAGSALIFNSIVDNETAVFVLKVQSIGWVFFIFYYFLFLAIFTRQDGLLKSPLLYVGGFGISVFFVFCAFMGKLTTCCAVTSYGLTSMWEDNWYVKAFFIYYVLLFVAAIIFLFSFRSRQKGASNALRMATDIIIASTIFCFVSGSISSVILKAMNIHVPLETNITMLVFLYAIMYSVEKFELFEMTAVKAADTIVGSVDEGIVFLTGDGTISFVNRKAGDIFASLAGAEGLKLAAVVKMGDIAGAISSGMEFRNREFEVPGEGGNKTVLISLFPVARAKKESGFICVINDITARKKSERELMDTITKLTRSNIELENFARIVSHDLKDPARTVLLYIQLISSKISGTLSGDERSDLETAMCEAERFHVIIDGILKYSRLRKEDLKCTGVPMERIIEAVRTALAEQTEISGAELLPRDASGMPWISGDENMLVKLFTELVDNGLKFNRSNGPKMEISAKTTGTRVIISVADNGIGIAPEYYSRIFEMFERLHGRGEFSGEGIGLALCKKIAELHGGKIWVEQGEKGGGSVFKVSLPAACEEKQ